MAEKSYFDFIEAKNHADVEKELEKLRSCYFNNTDLSKEKDVTGSVRLTDFWSWLKANQNAFRGFKSSFYNNPPISRARFSNQIMFIGTKAQLPYFSKYMTDAGLMYGMKKRKENSVLLSILHGLLTQNQNQINLGGVNDFYFEFCYRVGNFWEVFFGQEKFIDNIDQVSVPCAIISTGLMQDHSCSEGKAIEAEERLKEIASIWGIPYYYLSIPSRYKWFYSDM